MKIKLCGRELEFDQSVLEYNEFRQKFVGNMRSESKKYSDFYRENVWDFDTLYGNGLPRYSQMIADSRKFFIAVMQEYGVCEGVAQMIPDNSSIKNIINFYDYNASELENEAQKIIGHRAAHAGRRHYWEGGGFGLSGALKGALTAGALNMGADMLHGLGNAIGSASDHAKIRKMKNEIYMEKDHLELLLTGLESLYKDLLQTAVNILIRKNILKLPKFDSRQTEMAIDEAAGLIQTMTGDTCEADYEKIMDLICEGVTHDPYHLNVYGILYIIPHTNHREIQEFAQYFGMEEACRAEKEIVVKHFADMIAQIPEDTILQIEEKIEEIKHIQQNYEDMDFDDNIVKLEEKKHKCIIESIAQIPEKTIPQIEEKIEEIKRIQQNYEDMDFDDNIVKLEEKKRKLHQAEIEEAWRQAALAEAKKKAQIWERRLEEDKNTSEPNVRQIQKYLEQKDMRSIWKLVTPSNVYAEYILEKYYEKTIAPAIDTIDAVQFNQEVSGIRMYAEHGILFARYLLSYVHLLFWSEGYKEQEKVKKLLGNCAKAADGGCISAMVFMSDWLGKSDTEFTPKLSKSRNELIETAAENQHPKAMWQYGIQCKGSADDDLEEQAKARYYLAMSEYYGYIPPRKENTSSGCFITSAVCRTFNKPDDCYELTTFRAFRDNWLKNQPDGPKLIQEYYHTAPAIVEQIDKRTNHEEIYQFIWDRYLYFCIQLIEQQRFEQCKDRYIMMVNDLKERFCNKTVV